MTLDEFRITLERSYTPEGFLKNAAGEVYKSEYSAYVVRMFEVLSHLEDLEKVSNKQYITDHEATSLQAQINTALSELIKLQHIDKALTNVLMEVGIDQPLAIDQVYRPILNADIVKHSDVHRANFKPKLK
ncbi:MAG: hypothetical protein WCV88_05890 [Patescibacteria group bacterium]|jgi:hypothetical protein